MFFVEQPTWPLISRFPFRSSEGLTSKPENSLVLFCECCSYQDLGDAKCSSLDRDRRVCGSSRGGPTFRGAACIAPGMGGWYSYVSEQQVHLARVHRSRWRFSAAERIGLPGRSGSLTTWQASARATCLRWRARGSGQRCLGRCGTGRRVRSLCCLSGGRFPAQSGGRVGRGRPGRRRHLAGCR
jgi:hypothetical protein